MYVLKLGVVVSTVIPVSQEVEAEGLQAVSQPRQSYRKTLSQKRNKSKRAEGMA
jgi:hypothetical protein